MQSVICTLFEGHYHNGVAALVNSLHRQGYKGDVYAGYLGNLPKWAKTEKNNDFGDVEAATYFVNDDIRIHFIALKTSYHLTNYKPDFMKWLLEGPAKDANSIFYFDPDIVVSYKWDFFEDWVSYGITVCEDVNSPLSLNHPRKLAWIKYFGEKGIPLKFKQNTYANGGFVGVNRNDEAFISSWINVQEKMATAIGGLDHSAFQGKGHLPKEHLKSYFPFSRTDQDALNVTIGTWDGVVSFVGKEGMAIQSGPSLMFHALGPAKPWEANFIKQAIVGTRPRRVDKKFWKSSSYPIKLYSNNHIFRKNLALHLASFIGRFYSKF